MMATMLTREDRGPMTIKILLQVVQDNKNKLDFDKQIGRASCRERV